MPVPLKCIESILLVVIAFALLVSQPVPAMAMAIRPETRKNDFYGRLFMAIVFCAVAIWFYFFQ
jgi:hypothetical protein